MKTITKLLYLAVAVVSLAIGAVTADGAAGDLFTSVNGDPINGAGSIYQYTPTGAQSTFASGLSDPRGVAFDHFANLCVVNNTYDGVTQTYEVSIVKITPGGVQSTFATLSGDFFGEGVKFDRAGNLFVMAIDNPHLNFPSTIYKITPDGTQSTFGTTPGEGLGLAFDSAGDLFAADFASQTVYKFTPDGTQTIFVGPPAFQPDGGPIDLAFDAFGNLFVSEGHAPNGTARILKFTPDGMESEFATELNQARGLAFDRGRNLFVADIGGGGILKFTPNGEQTVFASGIATPEFLTIQLLPTPRPRPTPAPRPR